MDPAASWPEDLARLLTLRDANTRVVLIGTGLLGLASGVIGSFAVLRRRALVGDAVAHAALPGICAAYFVVGDRSFGAFLLGALLFGVLAAALISFIRASTRVKEDAATGIVIGSFFGLGLVLSKIIQNEPAGNRAGLERFLLGAAASMVRADAARIGLAAAAVGIGVFLFYKELKLLCFDRGFAQSLGFPAVALDLLLMGLICLCTVVGLPAVGVVLMVALLIIPGVTARFWTDRLSIMIAVAGLVGMVSGVLGTALSAALPAPAKALTRGWPTGPMIVLVAGACFLVSLLMAPGRGVISEALRRWALRRRIADQHLLRAVYERLEPAGDLRAPWLASALAITPSKRNAALARAGGRGLAERVDGGYRLTDRGVAEAARVVRAHRLWEHYLIDEASIAPDHVDRDADEIEHLLPADVLARIESRLRAEGRLPEAVPASPHVIPLPPGSAA